MGRLKALLPWCGRSLVEHQVHSLLQAGAARVVVVLGHRGDELQPLVDNLDRVCRVHNPDYRRGKTTSIRAGLRALDGLRQEPDDALLILNVDQPRSPETIRRIVDLHAEGNRAGPHLITVPTHHGKGGHPVVLSASLMPEMAAISEDTLGLKAVVKRHAADTQRVEVDIPEVLLDLNTPEEYHRALRTDSARSLPRAAPGVVE